MNLNTLFEPDLAAEIRQHGIEKWFEPETEILKAGQHVKFLPFVIEGAIKVFTQQSDGTFLLYYIEPNESCVMSFAAGLNNSPSKVRAVTNAPTQILLLPMDKVHEWIKTYPYMSSIFFSQYQKRYEDLVLTINELLFKSLDERLSTFLDRKAKIDGANIISMSHRDIAEHLGTAREVISRLLKKKEHQQELIQTKSGIKLLKL